MTACPFIKVTISALPVKIFMSKEGLKPGTVRNLKAYLSVILSDAVDDELIPANPASKTGKYIGSGGEDKEEIHPLTWEEKAKLEKAIKENYPRYYPLFLTAHTIRG